MPRCSRIPKHRVSRSSRRHPRVAQTSRRLACDASRVVMRHDAGGRVTRSVPGRAPFRRRYGGRSSIETGAVASRAAVSASARPTSDTGPIAADSARSRDAVSPTSRAVHEEGYRSSDRSMESEIPSTDSRPLPNVPPPTPVHRSVHLLRARHGAEGLHIDARTAMPGWWKP